ncbi:Stk1 family PASTA domain-containing Ser/Thr kinase [Nocardia thailandica]|uniref:non-specific serine/threonine protein kinase n=1 Tax=Nocardia thailandica TaxID=257275 RepID=A0ABW6PGD3_9NOCA|nr:Stk1 family PASTA domain-containing Ser/Thr kinase [Nocardia thailandica]
MTTPKNLSSRYELGEIIGFGGMSEVHKARDIRLSRDVAIKVLRADLARDPTFYLRFKREAQNAAALNHPAIVAVYDTGEATVDGGPLPYIVMEYVEGDTLRDIVRGKGPLPPRKAMEIIADVCAALDFSHKAGIVHRDMKPANIMLNRAGAVKVMDFGIARAMADSSNPMTQTAAVIGTAQYLSPEQARGEPVDARSDVYSVGCVLFEILTGVPPFTGDSPVAVAYQHVKEDPQLPSKVNPGIPRELDSVILKAMAKNPANRYQTAAEMRADLIRVLGGQKPSAPMVMTEEESYQSDDGYDDAYDDDDRGPHTGEYDPVPPERKRRTGWIALGAAAVVLVAAGLYWVLLGPGSKGDQVPIPDVSGKPSAQAEQSLREAGFLVSVNTKNDGKVAPGNVISTQPLGGSRLEKGSTVTMQVSAGPDQVQVPRLTNMTRESAEQTLNSIGLRMDPNVQKKSSSIAETDKVIASEPPLGTWVTTDRPIVIILGSGPEQARVPSVVGQDISVAEPNLTGAGFTVEQQETKSNRPRGEVLSTSPAGGSNAEKGSKITVQVSAGDKIVIPNLVGKTPQDAIETLRALGWTGQMNQSTVLTLDSSTSGQIMAQSPGAGSQLSLNGTVTVQVAASLR